MPYIAGRAPINIKSKRPDIARPQITRHNILEKSPMIGLISLGCPKALVDSERILTRLKNEGYSISDNYKGADAVIVNTCGFLDTAKAESLQTIGEALKENGKVIVTGCLGVKSTEIKAQFPSILNVSGPQQYQKVVDAVHKIVPPVKKNFINLISDSYVKLTPNHYSYLKISEGCNHKCKFCIIPKMRGELKSRSSISVLKEAERLSESGVKEILVISQDTSAYGFDKYNEHFSKGERNVRPHIVDLAKELGSLGLWIRLHYVYPYPHVRKLIPLMADKLILPYLDIPFQHSHPDVLKRMSRPANQVKTLHEIENWRSICPEITLRSSFIVGFPGETEDDFQKTIELCEKVQYAQAYSFKYSARPGTPAAELEEVSEGSKSERLLRLQTLLSRHQKNFQKNMIGKCYPVLIEKKGKEVGQVVGRSPFLQPVFLQGSTNLFGKIVSVEMKSFRTNSLEGIIAKHG